VKQTLKASTKLAVVAAPDPEPPEPEVPEPEPEPTSVVPERARREESLFNELLADPTLAAILELPLGLTYFKKYATQSGDADLVLFYFEVDAYKKSNMSRHLRVKAAQNIRKKFLTSGAEYDIDIDTCHDHTFDARRA
jgi:hypothetical protein